MIIYYCDCCHKELDTTKLDSGRVVIPEDLYKYLTGYLKEIPSFKREECTTFAAMFRDDMPKLMELYVCYDCLRSFVNLREIMIQVRKDGILR